jgi:hypothetical protein
MALTRRQRLAFSSEFHSFYEAISMAVAYSKFYTVAMIDFVKKGLRKNNKKSQESLTKQARERESLLKKAPNDWWNGFGVIDMTPVLETELEYASPHVNGLTLISMWSIAEAKIDDLAFLMLQAFPEILERDEFKNLKGNVVSMHKLPETKRIYYIFQCFKQKIDPSEKRGVDRFESILRGVNLGGGIDDDARRCLFGMSEIRHILVHRMGVADHKFVTACKDFQLSEGARIGVTLSLLEAYSHTFKWYILEIDKRLRTYLKEAIPEGLFKQQEFHRNHFKGFRTQKDPRRRANKRNPRSTDNRAQSRHPRDRDAQ